MRVTAIARSMVYDYAMGTQIRSHQLPADDYGASEAMRRTRDEEVQAISEEAYRGAHRLLIDHRDLLDEIGQRLLDNEVIEREEIQELMSHTKDALSEAAELPDLAPLRSLGQPAEALASSVNQNEIRKYEQAPTPSQPRKVTRRLLPRTSINSVRDVSR